MQPKSRRQFIVDSTLQGALLSRCVLYWSMCLAAVFVSLLCWDAAVGPPQTFNDRIANIWIKYSPAMLFVAALTPIMAFDFIRLSNRFAGPLVRLRRTMRDLGQGESVEPVVLRRSDFWREFADEFNAVITRVRQLESELAALRSEATAGAIISDPARFHFFETNEPAIESEASVVSVY
jgi:hypothetical protein